MLRRGKKFIMWNIVQLSETPGEHLLWVANSIPRRQVAGSRQLGDQRGSLGQAEWTDELGRKLVRVGTDERRLAYRQAFESRQRWRKQHQALMALGELVGVACSCLVG
jgi:hypothetical protein